MAGEPKTEGALGQVHPMRELEDGGPQPASSPSTPPTPVPAPVAAPVITGNEEFPVAFRHYAAALRGTEDEVWTRYLQIRHGRKNMTMTEWRHVHDSIRHEPAHWHRGY